MLPVVSRNSDISHGTKYEHCFVMALPHQLLMLKHLDIFFDLGLADSNSHQVKKPFVWQWRILGEDGGEGGLIHCYGPTFLSL